MLDALNAEGTGHNGNVYHPGINLASFLYVNQFVQYSCCPRIYFIAVRQWNLKKATVVLCFGEQHNKALALGVANESNAI